MLHRWPLLGKRWDAHKGHTTPVLDNACNSFTLIFGGLWCDTYWWQRGRRREQEQSEIRRKAPWFLCEQRRRKQLSHKWGWALRARQRKHAHVAHGLYKALCAKKWMKWDLLWATVGQHGIVASRLHAEHLGTFAFGIPLSGRRAISSCNTWAKCANMHAQRQSLSLHHAFLLILHPPLNKGPGNYF
jgi:hypothetical protein